MPKHLYRKFEVYRYDKCHMLERMKITAQQVHRVTNGAE